MVQQTIDKETNKVRMNLLKKLKAGVGQENRGLFESFFRAKKFIGHNQTCEDWGILDMPNERTMTAFLREVAEFEIDMREGRTP